MGEKVITENRRARHDYAVLDTVEAGLVLQGTEVKSLRAHSGGMTLKDSYAEVRGKEMFLVGTHIAPYEQGNIYNHEPERARKLLLHRFEIEKIHQRVAEKGLTIVPLCVYFQHGRVKVLLGICRGKHSYDKRTAIKEKETKREMARAVRDFQKR
jgi:SsrA-binding protein